MLQEPPKPYLSPAEYLEIERAAETRSEYLDGEMLLRESGNWPHNVILGNLIGELVGQLKGRTGHVCVTGQRIRVLGTGLYTYPDLLVVSGQALCEDEWDDTLLNPSLILEIFSPTTEAYDRGDKFYHYREIPALSEYVLVSQAEPRIDQFLRQDEEHWLYTPTPGRERSVSLASIGCELRLEEIYDKVVFSKKAPREPVGPAETSMDRRV
jgi:Uma2 family endonuclease